MSGKGELAKGKREDGLRRIANRIGCPSTSWISDSFLSLALGEPSPYGKERTELAKSLI